MNRKQLFLYGCFIFTAAIISSTAIAGGATRIQFAKGSYCGAYTGNFAGGKRFVLQLGRDQTFISRNTGNSNQLDVYVTGPTGQISGEKTGDNEIHYRTTAKGDYEIMVISDSNFSSVEFCVY
ncbi:hypothetical protein CXB77_17825 [Chromatium okenii]|jgi:hypothetical protein|uniref:Uncharacterized protein n=2 Tax=Chromatium okenii TaxID=61644 RepID=A0A2S7XML6_9GAMM|nr:hypothetical protein CXB77_17825 [Chromatium okenii]